ncbi:MAG: polyribonucleotide nucleotidyltransferase, partial [bacterium]|nr:polyribonucleotide nucleotidyltransferase [bacterium]
MIKKEYSIEVGGKTLTAQFTDLADQANGSVIIRYGHTAVLVTATMGGETDRDYFPLSVEYEEKYYAAGAILGSRFMRREGRPSDEAVLSARVVDRTIRPLFNQSLRRDIQIIITVLSIYEDDADVLGVIGASLALCTSDIPWEGPASAVRIGRNGEGFIVNPTYKERAEGADTIDLLACGKDGHINMMEVGADEVGEDVLEQGLTLAVSEMEKLQEWQKQIVVELAKEKIALETPETPEDIAALFATEVSPKMEEAIFGEKNGTLGKKRISALQKEWLTLVKDKVEDADMRRANEYFEEQVNDLLHKEALENNRRADGRAMDEIRPLYAQAGGLSDMIHGTGIFYRGGTHVLSALTLGGPGDAQLIDTIESQDTQKRYMHHYNFPPFSVGETGRVGGFNRRMIGHGILAEKALRPVIPPKEEFPYTIRIVSESMASNGSTSMASVCGSTLALMDGGVPIKRPVAGIAMGLMLAPQKNEENLKYKILTDIQGPEDHHGDMDFKVAGTREGVTAVQMDVKVDGVPVSVLMEAFEQAKKARMQILDVIEAEIQKPRDDINPRAPKIVTMTIKADQIGL